MLILIIFLASGEKEIADTGSAEDTSTTDTETDTDTNDTGTDTDTDEPTISSEIFAELTEQGGCGDYFIYARNADDTITLHISGSGLAQQAHEADGEIEVTYDINPADPSIQPYLVLKTGSKLNVHSCDDVFEDEPIVDSEWQAVSGSVSFVVSPDGEATDWGEYPAMMDVTLMDVCFGETEPICVESFGFASFIGWMPGK